VQERKPGVFAAAEMKSAPITEPDFSFPLESYTKIEDPDALNLIGSALSDQPWTDEQKLALGKGGAIPPDAFARKEAIERELPAIDAAIATHKSRYLRFDVFTIPSTRFPRGLWSALPPFGWFAAPFDGNNGLATIGSYDFKNHGFPMTGTFAGTVGSRTTSASSVTVSVDPPQQPAFFPVSDEATARRIESLRASGTRFAVRGVLYVFVSGASYVDGPRSSLRGRLVRAQLSLLDGSKASTLQDQTVAELAPLAEATIDFNR
jgi:hypothetical protein